MSTQTTQAVQQNDDRGTVTRQEFGAQQVERRAETAVSAAAAQAQAQVQAMYVMALQRPRDMVAVRERLLAECRRRGFAEAAQYSVPRAGKKIVGPSVRFAEAALRALTNIHVRTTILYDDAERRVGDVTAIDLEANVPLSAGWSIDKTIERKRLQGGETVFSERVNSSGETVYRIAGTEADVLQKQESTISRIRRNLILQLLPGDLKDEALATCRETLRRGDAADPAAAAKKLADAFATLGISVAKLREYLGHGVDEVAPDEAEDLRGVYAAIRDGETTWAQVMETRGNGERTPEEASARAELLKAIAAARIREPERYHAALTAVGVAAGVATTSLPTETLQRVAAAMAEDAAAEGARQAVDSVPDPADEDGSPTSPAARFQDVIDGHDLDGPKARKLAAEILGLGDARKLTNDHYSTILEDIESFLAFYHGDEANADAGGPEDGSLSLQES